MKPPHSDIFKTLTRLGFLMIIGILQACTYANQTQVYDAEKDAENPVERPVPETTEKITGVSFVGPPAPVKLPAFESIAKQNAGWVALLPYSFGSGSSPDLSWNLDWQWWGERFAGLRQEAVYAKELGLKIMVKPQIWFRGGSYTGDFDLKNDQLWESFEEKYKTFILEYAQLAQEIQADLFCLGTELKTFCKKRPDFWKELGQEVKKIYSGKLTYAGNWDSFLDFPCWDKMDYIGVDAYFPLSSEKTPSVTELEKGWDPHIEVLQKLARKHGKPILFTEFGYKSVDYCAERPWEHREAPVNMQAQANAYQAFFNRIWNQDWFAGGFLWNWYPDYSRAGGLKNTDFTPQNKPAMEIIADWYDSSR